MVKGAHEYAATEFAVDFGSSFDFYESILGGDRFSSSNLLSLMITPPGPIFSQSPGREKECSLFHLPRTICQLNYVGAPGGAGVHHQYHSRVQSSLP